MMKKIEYENLSKSKQFQEEVTNLLADLSTQYGVTLAELGYLHMNSILYNGRSLEMAVYFLPELACETRTLPNGSQVSTPKAFFNALSGYFYYGELKNNCGLVSMSIPRYKVKTNDDGHKYLMVKDKLDEREEEVMAIYCNVDMVMAAIHDISLMTPGYRISYNSIGSTKKKRPIMISASSDMYPIDLSVEWDDSDSGCYDVREVGEYFEYIISNKKEKKKAEGKIAKKASSKSKKPNKMLSGYSKYR